MKTLLMDIAIMIKDPFPARSLWGQSSPYLKAATHYTKTISHVSPYLLYSQCKILKYTFHKIQHLKCTNNYF